MTVRRLAVVAAALVALVIPAIQAQEGVPSDLKTLLARPVSEMRLVVTRYTADRQTLNQNFAGPGGFNMGRGGRGRGQAIPGATPAPSPVSVQISTARLARLKRYDLDWQAALGRLATAKFSAQATADLASLKKRIEANLQQLEAENLELAQIAPALPFAPKLIALIEARIRVDDINWEHAARSLTEVKKWIETTTAGTPAKLNSASAARAIEATD